MSVTLSSQAMAPWKPLPSTLRPATIPDLSCMMNQPVTDVSAADFGLYRQAE